MLSDSLRRLEILYSFSADSFIVIVFYIYIFFFFFFSLKLLSFSFKNALRNLVLNLSRRTLKVYIELRDSSLYVFDI